MSTNTFYAFSRDPKVIRGYLARYMKEGLTYVRLRYNPKGYYDLHMTSPEFKGSLGVVGKVNKVSTQHQNSFVE